jgi:lysozyme family protein
MWYRNSQTQTSKPPSNKGGYQFTMPSGKPLPWYSNIQLDPSKYSQTFINWVNSQLHPEDERGGEGGLKKWSGPRGGLTNKGITQDEYDAFRKSQNQPLQSVAKIAGEEVRQILHRNYWARLNADKLPPMVAKVVASYGLLRGAEEAATELQKLIKKSIPSQPVTGNIYDKTADNTKQLAITKQAEHDLAILLLNNLSSKLLSQKGMAGYKVRIDNLKKLIDEMYAKNKTPKQVSDLQNQIDVELNNLPLV